MKIVKHILVPAAVLFLILGIPILSSDAFAAWRGKEKVDTLGSASLVVDRPSGVFYVFLNTAMHPDDEARQIWVDFFEGREIPVFFEDITCAVAAGDAAGAEMAWSLQTRLPEHQMSIRTEDPILLLSKAETGRYDAVLLSKEYADLFGTEALTARAENRTIEIGEAS